MWHIQWKIQIKFVSKDFIELEFSFFISACCYAQQQKINKIKQNSLKTIMIDTIEDRRVCIVYTKMFHSMICALANVCHVSAASYAMNRNTITLGNANAANTCHC